MAVMLIAGQMFAQIPKFSPLNAEKGTAIKKYAVQNDLFKDIQANTDTLWNVNWATDQLTYYGFGATVWGTWTGQNQYTFTDFAEKFTNSLSGDVNGIIYYVAKKYQATTGNSITFKVWDGGATPGTLLGSKTVDLSTMTDTNYNYVEFASPVPITGDFYIGYTVDYNTPVDTFSMAQTVDDTTSTNTFYFYYNGGWTDMPTLTGGGVTATHLAVGACVNLQVPTTPTASVDLNAWNAGDIEVASSATSGTFTLTNIGNGTLTVSGITDLSATPFSTTLVPGDVSLGNAAIYTFTFNFDPTVAGTFNQTFTIQTNGGNIDIILDGIAHDPYGDMLGDFENIAAFDLVFPGWVQHDVDGSATYGMTGITFTNSGYTGSFIAFNPSQTSPPMSADSAIQPHGGAQFGACFDASTPPNDDWLVTPQHTVVTGDNIEMWVKTYTSQWGYEKYEVFVSTASSDVADFTTSLSGSVLDADTIWTKDTYDLSAYVGQSVYIGIHCTSNDAFIFMIDDIKFANSTNISNENTESVSMFPNPTTGILNIRNAGENSDIQIYNIMGELVLSANNISRTVDVSDLTEGTYIVKVISKDNVTTQKINLIK